MRASTASLEFVEEVVERVELSGPSDEVLGNVPTCRAPGELYVSFNTVKTRVRSIFASSTSPRPDAVSRARELRLL